MDAARQMQLIRFRELRYGREFAERTHHLYPETAEEIMSIYTNGAAPKYTPEPPKAVPGDGYPHNAEHTVAILESMWEDAKQLKAFISATTALTFGERIEYSPTTTAPKRLPDRTFSDKCRTVSDLRRINLGINTEDFPPIWLHAIKHIAERIIRKKRQYPGVPIKVCKRDISNAFKRAPLHPDYITIFCHQFAAQSIGVARDAAVGWLAFPSGFAASPAIFAMCTDAIQKVHRSGQAQDGSWSGWEAFWSEIFAGDAIFVEADIGNILNVTVSAWETARRGLFGMCSIDREKVDLEGAWGATGLILGFDIDTVEELITSPPPKVDGAMIYLRIKGFVAGSQHVTLKALQTLRGYMQRWLVASMSWESCVLPVDLMLTYGSDDCLAVNCPNYQVRIGYWDMLSLLQRLAKDEEAWETLFRNTLPRTIAINRRFSRPRI